MYFWFSLVFGVPLIGLRTATPSFLLRLAVNKVHTLLSARALALCYLSQFMLILSVVNIYANQFVVGF
uniref:Uncharacterized protein n=1 Tax=Anopheles darlingi TaxID=43151 RepID=A0A2M4D913_ANODA